MSGAYRPWLIARGSLTASLQQRYGDFTVKPLCMADALPFFDESKPLSLPSYRKALIREVELWGKQQPVVFAHSVLPHASLRGRWYALGKLGNKPLGAILFADKRVKRAPLEYKKLSPHHALYRHAARSIRQKPPYLWARRSVFTLNCAKMMVTEVFLPTLLNNKG